MARNTDSIFCSYGSSVFVFTSTLVADGSFFYILVIFLSVFYDKSAVFMPFLRSSSFAKPLLFDKSAFYLTANQCHSEGRREADGKQNGLTAFWHPVAFVSIFASLASCCKDNGSMA